MNPYSLNENNIILTYLYGNLSCVKVKRSGRSSRFVSGTATISLMPSPCCLCALLNENKSGKEAFNVYGHELFDDISIDIDGLRGKWNDYYYRVDVARAPHNVMGNPLLAQALYDYEPKPLSWLFDSEKVYNGEDGTQVDLALCSNVQNYVSYTYDAQSDVYLRSMQGKAFFAAETDAQLFVKNVIVQYSTYKKSATIKIWAMTGSGDADIYIGGKLIKGSWQRESSDDKTVYLDADGNQIVLRAGNTWIHISPYK